MIDIPTLRKLGTDPVYAPPAVFANACSDAADAMEDLCKQIDGSVRVAAEAIAERDALRAALINLLPPKLDWKEQGDGRILIEIRKVDLRSTRDLVAKG